MTVVDLTPKKWKELYHYLHQNLLNMQMCTSSLTSADSVCCNKAMLDTLRWTLHTAHCTLYTGHCIVHNIQCTYGRDTAPYDTLHTTHWTLQKIKSNIVKFEMHCNVVGCRWRSLNKCCFYPVWNDLNDARNASPISKPSSQSTLSHLFTNHWSILIV